MSAIDKSTSIIDIVQKYPETVAVFRNFGMGCLGCAAARFESLEQGALAHGIDVADLLAALNKVVEQK